MVYDHLSHQARYRGLHPGFDLGFDYLMAFDPGTADGKYALDGDRVIASVESYMTLPAEEKKFESHRNYIDIQFIVTGEEIIYHTPIDLLDIETPYNAAKDYLKYTGREDQALIMRPETFAIFFPHDGHKPGCTYRRDQAVRKIVVKIRN